MGAALPYIAAAGTAIPVLQSMGVLPKAQGPQAPATPATPGTAPQAPQTDIQPMTAPKFSPKPMGAPMSTPPDLQSIIKMLTSGGR